MAVNKRNKNKRFRGSMTHGWGSKKKHRGSGNRGGFGMAGTGKRADQNKISILKYRGHEYFGKKGFKRPQKILKKSKTINIGLIEQKLKYYLSVKKVKEDNGKFIINLKDLGYDKLLGSGKAKSKMEITGEKASKKAMDKLEKIGGKFTSQAK
ncbi:50S ribosomal protein L15 [archaeon]|nr:50S ribosomal protein L15 [archaeon]|tara:strand:- start:19 stop:477 length:459 start_codon:yes stop_codon:yes gene_type:complete